MRTCPVCKEGTMRAGQVSHRLTRAGTTFVRSSEALVCDSCEENLTSLEELRSFELQAAWWLARHGVKTPDAFKFMRKAAGYKAKDLAQLLGVAPETVSRWENGGLDVSHSAFAILGALVRDAHAGHDDVEQALRASLSKPPPTLPGEVNLTDRLSA